MRFIYSFLFNLLSPLLLIRLYWKGKKLPAYRQRIKERFCLEGPAKPVDVWLHAVSLGEVVAAVPLIEQFLAKNKKVLITTMTPTGSEQIIKRFAEKVVHQYVPYDLGWVTRRFFAQYKPKIAVIMETELWPNLIHHANKRKIPLFLVNARISDKAFQSYLKTKFFFQSVVRKFTKILAQSDIDSTRFIELGAANQRVANCGNIKFDIKLNAHFKEELLQMKEVWGQERAVFIAASTHEGEEEEILKHLPKLQERIPNILLLIAPRHPERFEHVFQLSKKYGFNTQLRTEFKSNAKTEVIIVNSLGELLTFYKLSDFAFVGGSIISTIGGHNVLEPIALQKPVVTGPYMQNSREIFEGLCNKNALRVAKNGQELVDVVSELYLSPEQYEDLVSNASRVMQANQGTVQRILREVEGYW
ncbi:3-deoxy-D-manno-oct-2-ulosonic acid transferase (plasmid) [Legionella adelaidensis]|uniref:3-deoxy-D-manno-octulosonic acid transferase n=1 Tax=Legionella adelaidensis TaxID=45056 RepID=A0A0W0R2U6_9GAMM|nr:lipid IV(A) 3-deoxy-D-manno-octulosonic acid transferase [Legionella adelaidensis]KTC65394.1 3-deoxy-D-manno-oct-2-ulosonic acid transferase [Legionella adelaidensis]VEH84784.1 3-deoxy-D-manno-oct-2-ulosonic acid transferase [Legionella adelaidensis]